MHSGTSHLFGASGWLPIRGGVGRLTVEYASSLATRDLWGSGIIHGFSYNNYGYQDGMRYRDRTLGFSLDSDSTLLSVQASFTDANARSYTLTYHDAEISNPLNVPNRVSSWTNMATWGNVVTTAPVSINLVDARVSLPLTLGAYDVHLDFGGRLQDDQPRPDKGFLASIEVAMRIAL